MLQCFGDISIKHLDWKRQTGDVLAPETTLSSNANHDKSHFQLAVCNQSLVSAVALCNSEDAAHRQDTRLCICCARRFVPWTWEAWHCCISCVTDAPLWASSESSHSPICSVANCKHEGPTFWFLLFQLPQVPTFKQFVSKLNCLLFMGILVWVV